MTLVRYTKTSRLGPLVMLASAAIATAHAEPLRLPANDTIDYSIYQRPVDLAPSPRAQPPANEQTGNALLGTKLDFSGAQLQLYRFRLDKTPFNSTLPNQQIDAGGIKLKWSW
jgi:hypothetical protein